jgi:hypothetical protein
MSYIPDEEEGQEITKQETQQETEQQARDTTKRHSKEARPRATSNKTRAMQCPPGFISITYKCTNASVVVGTSPLTGIPLLKSEECGIHRSIGLSHTPNTSNWRH